MNHTQTCELCGRMVVVVPDGRGFPPDIAKRKLQRVCWANGCECKARYRAEFVCVRVGLHNCGGQWVNGDHEPV